MQSSGAFARVAGRLALAAVLSFGGAALAADPNRFPNTMFADGLEDASFGPATDADAARFLAQATFGPTDADIARVRAIGYQAWLDEQFAAAASLKMSYFAWLRGPLDENPGIDSFWEAWLLGALGGPDPQNNLVLHTDQLRQRVAFALSEIFVVSDQNSSERPNGIAHYYDILTQNAFGNYRTLLEQVTLSPAMGVYLNMRGNPRADLQKNRHPDENYAREVKQLFSVGLNLLNPDGTVQTAQGQPIPTYSQATVTAFAHVFTGWEFAGADEDSFGWHYPDDDEFEVPMVAFAAWHDNGTQPPDDLPVKQLLAYPGAANGGLLAAGGTPQSDLAFALDNIFRHPNVGPFIGKQLIQRLVTSNPSPQYVQRVAAAFDDDGTPQHVRGNLKAVVRAILLDAEARQGHYKKPTTYGKLREPLLRVTHLWRAMGARHHCGLNFASGGGIRHYANQPYRYGGWVTGWALDDTQWGVGPGQAPLHADSVFNFFKPSYVPSGEMTALGLLGPEFQMDTDSLSVNSTNNVVYKSWIWDLADACDPNDEAGDIVLDRAQDYALAGSANGGPGDPADRLVDAYNRRFMSGQMSAFMRQTLLAYLNPIGSGNGSDWRKQRINRALLLIMTSPEYMVQK